MKGYWSHTATYATGREVRNPEGTLNDSWNLTDVNTCPEALSIGEFTSENFGVAFKVWKCVSIF